MSQLELFNDRPKFYPKHDEHLEGWKEFLGNDTLNVLAPIVGKVANLYHDRTCYPEYHDIFKAFEITKPEDIRVVILGQDPYHDGNATGLAFGCKIKETPSLAQIKNAIDVHNQGIKDMDTFDDTLQDWAEQGVLLLNTKLTVTESSPNSHTFVGWEDFTDEVVNKISLIDKPIAWFLWGRDAQKYESKIKNSKHLVICDVHPAAASYNKENWKPNCFYKYDGFCVENEIDFINW